MFVTLFGTSTPMHFHVFAHPESSVPGAAEISSAVPDTAKWDNGQQHVVQLHLEFSQSSIL